MFGLSKERPILDHHAKAHIPWNPADFIRISWNPADFRWNLADFTMKSSGFHEIHEIQWISGEIRQISGEIWRISPWKSSGFHEIHEIQWISGEIWQISWNPWNPVDFRWNLADFTQISPVKSTQNYKSKCFSKNSSVWWMQGGGFHPGNPPDFTLKSGGFHLWNLVDFTQISPVKSTQNYKSKCFSKNSSVWWMQGGGYDQGFHEIHQISPMKSGGFHPDFTCEIHPNYKSKCFSKNSSVWWMQGGGYDQGFHEIHQISPWNLVDFTCEIQQSSPRISSMKSTQNYKSKCFSKNSSVWWMQGGGFHPWNPMDFTLKSGGFHPWNLADLTQIWPVKSTQNYKNLVDFTGQIWVGISPWKSSGFHPEIWWIYPWNLADFTQISPVKSTQNYKSKCFSKNSSVWWMQGGGFHPEIWWISPVKSGGFNPRFDLWNPPKIIKASVSAKTLQFDECKVGDFTLEIQWISPMKSGRFHPDFTCEIHPKFKSKCFSKTLQFDECRVGDFTLKIWWISPWNLVDFSHEIWQISPRFHLWNPPKL